MVDCSLAPDHSAGKPWRTVRLVKRARIVAKVPRYGLPAHAVLAPQLIRQRQVFDWD